MKLNPKLKNLLKVVALIALVYLFLVAIKLFGDAFKAMGKTWAEAIVSTVSNPMLGLFVGIFATSIVQSSSFTTSLVVSLVAGGAFGTDPAHAIYLAVPIIMGANIGTSVTNFLVSLGHMNRQEEFARALPASSVHDFFNVLSVLVLFPLQYFFNVIGKAATFVANGFSDFGGMKMMNPVGAVVSPVAKSILHLFPHHPWIGIIVAIILLFLALRYIVVVIKSLVLKKVELFFDQYLFKTTARALIVGMLLTALVQSSSITTSLAVPLAAAGVITLKQIYPYSLGANIGTTITALLASFATDNITAVTIALSHLLFNVFGIMIFLPLKKIPIGIAEIFGKYSLKYRYLPIVYIVLVFFLIPLAIIFIMR